jgi:ElaB/YqjD/DUF883 family membrane-anchored ribosome-binding protein
MSDLSIIAHDYALNAEFARRFNEAVLNLKRFYLIRRGDSGETEKRIQDSRAELRKLLDSLIAALQDKGKPWTPEQAQVPADVLQQLRRRLKGELDQAVVELRQVADDLVAGKSLGEPSFSALDRVCEAADATASAAFRRLRRI